MGFTDFSLNTAIALAFEIVVGAVVISLICGNRLIKTLKWIGVCSVAIPSTAVLLFFFWHFILGFVCFCLLAWLLKEIISAGVADGIR
jgi:hypothetical protein